MKNRWYDEDPTLSLAISLMKNSHDELRLECAKHIIESLPQKAKKKEKNVIKNLNDTFIRWYDRDPLFSEAMELLRKSSLDQKKVIAIEIIEILEHAQTRI